MRRRTTAYGVGVLGVRRPNRRRWLPVFLSATILLILAIVLLWVCREEAPVAELREARLEWNAARERSGIWAADLESAASLLDSSQVSLDGQFIRFPLLRRFGPTRALIAAARDSLLSGEKRAADRRSRYRVNLDVRVARLSESLAGARILLERMQTDQNALNALKSAEAHLTVIRGLLDAERPDEIERMLEQAESDVVRSTMYLRRRLDGFLSRRTAWDEWTRELLDKSRRSESHAILVDKLNRTCFVLHRGEIRDSFPIEMGPNWMSRKLYSGDRATPEGRYRVVQLKTGRQTIYYKAALIDYPNAEDRRRHESGMRSGAVPAGAGVGSLIQIHGKGGRGSDWTLGCVGLENSDMDRLMRYLRVGTPVFIVGFLREPAWLALVERDGLVQ